MEALAAESGHALVSAAFAAYLDERDELRDRRQDFLFPKVDGVDALYLCGNSLGLQPKRTKDLITEQLDKWADEGVEGHFTEPTPWLTIDGARLFVPRLFAWAPCVLTPTPLQQTLLSSPPRGWWVRCRRRWWS